MNLIKRHSSSRVLIVLFLPQKYLKRSSFYLVKVDKEPRIRSDIQWNEPRLTPHHSNAFMQLNQLDISADCCLLYGHVCTVLLALQMA